MAGTDWIERAGFNSIGSGIDTTRTRSILNRVEFMYKKRVFAVVPGECPRCKSYCIKRVARQGILEKLIFPILGLWPYRCQGCDLKYFDYVRYAILRSERHSESGEAEPS